ncbi:FliG C-terminal domain-containing protein [bacterium]
MSAKIFEKWITDDEDAGIKNTAKLFKTTDPNLLSFIDEYLDKDTVSKINLEISNIDKIDSNEMIELFKIFRKDMQNEEMLTSQQKSSKTEHDSIFNFLRQLSKDVIFHIVKDEPTSIAALVLAQLSPDTAHSILKELSVEKQRELPLEIGRLKKIPLSSYRDIANKLSRKAMDLKKMNYVNTDGVEVLINILEHSSPEIEKDILSNITRQDLGLAEEIKKTYVTFDELVHLPDKVLSDIIKSFDRDVITHALVSAEPAVKEKILKNLPGRIRDIATDKVQTFEETGELDFDTIQGSRRLITKKIRESVKSGKIDLSSIATLNTAVTH